MKTVALIPIKLNSQRLPHKNILPIAGHPLCWHLCNTLNQVKGLDDVYVYCSDPAVQKYIPEETKFLQRPEWLDGDLVKGFDIYREFGIEGVKESGTFEGVIARRRPCVTFHTNGVIPDAYPVFKAVGDQFFRRCGIVPEQVVVHQHQLVRKGFAGDGDVLTQNLKVVKTVGCVTFAIAAEGTHIHKGQSGIMIIMLSQFV